jgi:hypothetical protein
VYGQECGSFEIVMADVWKVARDVAKLSGGEIVFIGGVATYLHVQRRPKAVLPLEKTHDVDASISAVASGIIRDHHEFTENHHLHKAQIRVDNIDVDLYPQQISRLRFSYLDLAPYAQRYRGFQIAAIPHILLLKVDAIEGRGNSGKGAKDRRDAAKLLVLLRGSPQARQLLAGLAAPSDLKSLRAVAKSPALMEIVHGNAKTASTLRKKAEEAIDAVERMP